LGTENKAKIRELSVYKTLWEEHKKKLADEAEHARQAQEMSDSLAKGFSKYLKKSGL